MLDTAHEQFVYFAIPLRTTDASKCEIIVSDKVKESQTPCPRDGINDGDGIGLLV